MSKHLFDSGVFENCTHFFLLILFAYIYSDVPPYWPLCYILFSNFIVHTCLLSYESSGSDLIQAQGS